MECGVLPSAANVGEKIAERETYRAVREHGELPSANELAKLAEISYRKAQSELENLEAIALSAMNETYVASCRAERSKHHHTRKLLGNELVQLIDLALGIQEEPAQLVETDLAQVEREIVDNLLAFDCPERFSVINLVSASIGGDCERMASAVESLPLKQEQAPIAYQPTRFTGDYTSFADLGRCAFAARLGFEVGKDQERIIQSQNRIATWKRISAHNGTAQEQARAV